MRTLHSKTEADLQALRVCKLEAGVPPDLCFWDGLRVADGRCHSLALGWLESPRLTLGQSFMVGCNCRRIKNAFADLLLF